MVIVATVALATPRSVLTAADEAPGPAQASDETRLDRLGQRAERELRDNILPFWLEHARDDERGGFRGLVQRDLTVVEDAPRGALLTSRILWTFSAAARRYPENAVYREMARRAYDDLRERFADREHGGYLWSVTVDGRPDDDRKHIYGQAFAIYALSEYFLLTHDDHAREAAIAVYRLLEQHARDRQHGGYFEELGRDWRHRRDMPAGQRFMGPRGTKSQNAHLHMMEAYTNLLRAWPDAQLRADLRALTDIMLTRVLDPETHHLRLFFDDDWTSLSRDISYGHDIEFSWLICEAAGVLGDAALITRARDEAVRIAHACLQGGVDADGGMFNLGGERGIIDDAKDWWNQAEAAVGFVNAWQLSRDPRFLAAAEATWQFIDTCLVNRDSGEWYQSTDRAGKPDLRAPLLSMWKCPYHNSRACLEIVRRVGERE